MSQVFELKWFIASVRSCQERRVAEKLSSRGIQSYVPVQKVKRRWSDRVKTVDKLLIPGLVFIRCDEKTRKSLFDWLYGVAFFLMDRSGEIHTPLVVPDKQMDDFMTVVRVLGGETTLTVVEQNISKGDMVRVINGPLKDFVCECVELQDQHRIVIRLGSIGALLATISVSDVLKI